MTIKHIVISGGGTSGINALGILQHLEKEKYWSIDNIESIFSSSIGSVIAVLLCLKIQNWDIINDYIILRPWNKTYKISLNMIFDSFSKKGIFNEDIITTFFKPFFDK